MSCDIEVEPACVALYNELKLQKAHKYIIYSISDDKKTVKVEKCPQTTGLEPKPESEEREAYKQFLSLLPSDDCRYIVYDFVFEKSPEDGLRNKICFIMWSPDTAPVRKKMLYASCKETSKSLLSGIALEIQATDEEEVSYDHIKEKLLVCFKN
ncbi:MAG: cofilin [Amphiamblys sp. WSBS2006]|nr:MAG: cofilin [Amphiamblys sp. WSBS2006]